jgi:hypothetical protein
MLRGLIFFILWLEITVFAVAKGSVIPFSLQNDAVLFF